MQEGRFFGPLVFNDEGCTPYVGIGIGAVLLSTRGSSLVLGCEHATPAWRLFRHFSIVLFPTLYLFLPVFFFSTYFFFRPISVTSILLSLLLTNAGYLSRYVHLYVHAWYHG